MEPFDDAIKSGEPIDERYTVRRVNLDLTPRKFGPDEVKGIRAMIGVSQPIFGHPQFVVAEVLHGLSNEIASGSDQGRARCAIFSAHVRSLGFRNADGLAA